MNINPNTETNPVLEEEQHLLSGMHQQMRPISTPDLLLPHTVDRERLYPAVFGYETLPGTPYKATASKSAMKEPMFHLPPQTQPPMLREVLHSLLPNKDNFPAMVLEHERRRLHNHNINVLRELVPNCSKKGGKAAILGDAISYIQELQALTEKNRNGQNGRDSKTKKAQKTTKQQDNNNNGGCSFFSKTWTLVWGSCMQPLFTCSY